MSKNRTEVVKVSEANRSFAALFSETDNLYSEQSENVRTKMH